MDVSLYCPMRNSDQMKIVKAHTTSQFHIFFFHIPIVFGFWHFKSFKHGSTAKIKVQPVANFNCKAGSNFVLSLNAKCNVHQTFETLFRVPRTFLVDRSANLDGVSGALVPLSSNKPLPNGNNRNKIWLICLIGSSVSKNGRRQTSIVEITAIPYNTISKSFPPIELRFKAKPFYVFIKNVAIRNVAMQ